MWGSKRQGERGVQGERGLQGNQGNQGEAGERGEAGKGLNEMEITAARLASSAERIADKAADLKEIADQLRADVDALTQRVSDVETTAGTVAEELVVADKKVEKSQGVQDGRLDTLES